MRQPEFIAELTPLQQRFSRFSAISMLKQKDAARIFCDIEQHKQMFTQQWANERLEKARSTQQREAKWRKKLEQSPFLDD